MPLLSYNEFAASSQVGGTIREDLLDYIENLSPADCPLYQNLGSIQISAGLVEFLEDTYRARAVNAFTEGAAATDVALTVPNRLQALAQNFQAHYWVSGRQDAVNHAGMATMSSYQAVKSMTVFKTDLEHALHRGSAVTGNTGTAPQLNGILNLGGTYFTASSGTTLKTFLKSVSLWFARTIENWVNSGKAYLTYGLAAS